MISRLKARLGKFRIAFRTQLDKYRIAIFSAIALLIVILTLIGTGLVTQLRELSTAEDDNLLWGVLEIDNEFANLSATLSIDRQKLN